MFIKGVAFAAEELSPKQLKQLERGDEVTLGVRPDREPEEIVVIKVRITATDHQEFVTRVEGYAFHNEKRAKVTALLTLDPTKQGDGYAELIFYS